MPVEYGPLDLSDGGNTLDRRTTYAILFARVAREIRTLSEWVSDADTSLRAAIRVRLSERRAAFCRSP